MVIDKIKYCHIDLTITISETYYNFLLLIISFFQMDYGLRVILDLIQFFFQY